MTIGMFSPYLPKHFGGGERHFLTTAAYLSQRHTVEILLAELPRDLDKKIQTYQTRFDLDLSAIQWQASKVASGQQSAWATWRETAQYDAFFYLTDGSLFFNGSARGVLHVQIPFTQPLSMASRLKLKTWQVLNTNSQFTKGVIERTWKRPVDVVHAPFVDTTAVPTKLPTKHPEILSVGRFIEPGSAGQNKRQDILIQAFISGCLQNIWPAETVLHIVGALEPGSHHQAYLDELQARAQGYPIKFHIDVSNDAVLKLYQRCQVYWHATGFEIDETAHPELTEHFGMTPLEALAWGCIPVVVPKGGVLETIEPNVTGLTYNTTDELLQQTEKILMFSPSEAKLWQTRARASAERYSLSRFCQTIDQMLQLPQVL